MTPPPLVAALERWRYGLLVLLGGLMVVGGSQHVTMDTDWQFFTWGSNMLFGTHDPFVRESYRVIPTLPGGLHLYANYSFLQIGPPPLLLARILQVGPRSGLFVAGAVVQLLGLLFVYALDLAYRAGPRLYVLLGGALTSVVWGSLSQFRHLDDAMTLTALALAALAISRGSPLLAGLLLGLAAASKPWGAPLLALVLVPPTLQGRVRAGLAAVAVVGLFWAPFVLADRDTLLLGQATLYLSPDSVPAALGVHDVGSGQSLRLLQAGIGTCLAVLLVLRGRWELAPLAAFATRLLLDPGAYPYYSAGIVAAALLADLGGRPGKFPVLTAAATTAWLLTEIESGATAGLTRLVFYGGLVLAVVAAVRHRAVNPARMTS